MKIGILTLKLHANYGGILQAFALQKTLKGMGHEVETLQTDVYFSLSNKKLVPLIYAKRILKKILGLNKNPINVEKRMKEESMTVSQNTRRFISDYIRIRKIDNLHQVKPTDYDLIIVGSDQVWRKKYFEANWRCDISNAFLSFTEGWKIRRGSYAASFGTDNINNEYSSSEIDQCKRCIASFDEVSVREESGIDICKSDFDIDANLVLDPTMLLDKSEYVSLIKKIDITGSKRVNDSLMSYILDPNEFKTHIKNYIERTLNIKPNNFGVERSDLDKPIQERVQPSVEDWLNGFNKAKFVITDSFHACVFSILFNKPFVVIGNKRRGLARFQSLLRLFSLENRLVTEGEDYKKTINTPIDWDSVNSKLAILRCKSVKYIEACTKKQ